MNIALLEQLKRADGQFVAPIDLGLNLDTIQRDLDALESFGFVLERHPYLGVAYRGPAVRLCPDQIEWELAPRKIGRRIAVWNRVTSTNDLAAKAATSTANDGLVILAEEQTEGRGRRGRQWTAPDGSSLLLSVLLFPPRPFDNPTWLTALGAAATAIVVEEHIGQATRIKWPNDVRVGGRKVGGILVERGVGAVIGIGLNVNWDYDDFPEDLRESATSLRLLTGARCDRSALAHSLIRCLDDLYERGLRNGTESLNSAWSSRFEALDRDVELETAGGRLRGRLLRADLESGFSLADGETTASIPVLDVIAITLRDAG